MRYRDIKPAVCSCCFPNLLEDSGLHGLQFNRQTFYNNMQQLIDSGTASNLEGVDTLVRLGYLEKVDSETIFGNFELENPIAGAQNRGSYNSALDVVRMAYDIVFEPGSMGSASGTLAHELRHRAFYIISVTPELEALMPEELRTRWPEGYGRHQHNERRWQHQEAFASPEHAMIYAVQHSDPLSNDSYQRFFNNPALENQTVQYWRDLYRSIESAVSNWFQDRVPRLTANNNPAERAAPFELTAREHAFYSTLSSISAARRQNLADILYRMRLAFLDIMFNTQGESSLVAVEIVEEMNSRNFEAMPALLQRYRALAADLAGNSTAKEIDQLLTAFEDSGISWRLMDIDTFTPAEFAALIRLRPDLVPAVPVATVEPQPSTAAPRGAASASTPEPEQTPTVAPVGNTIGLYQFTVSTRMHPRHTATLWDNIASANSVQALRSVINGIVGLRMDDAGLIFDSTAQAQLEAMYRILETDGYNKNVVSQMLARIVLVKG